MKAMVYYGKNDLRFEERPKPIIIEPTDALIRLTKTTICGTERQRNRANSRRKKVAGSYDEPL